MEAALLIARHTVVLALGTAMGATLGWGAIAVGEAPRGAGPPAKATPTASAPAEEGAEVASELPSVEEIDGWAWKGDYARAIEAYREYLKSDLPEHESSRTPAAIGLSRALAATGKYEEALSVLNQVAFDAAGQVDWLVARVEVLFEIGHVKDALTFAQRAMTLEPNDSTARRCLGQLYEETGHREEAIETFAWFDALLRRGYPARAEILTDSAIGIYRHAILSQRRDAAKRTRYVLHELLQPAYERVNKSYWPARLVSADLLLSKYNLRDAAEDYRAALKINPHLVRAHVGLGRIALEEWAFEEADEHLRRAMEVNPRSPLAHRFAAELHLQERKFDEAIASAEKALETNPHDVEALGLMAAGYWRQFRIEEAKKAYARAEELNPESPMAPYTLGNWLAAGRQFAEAERYLKEAIEREPIWANPQTALGMAYMQSGDERAARRVLDASWRLDPYNVETKNTLDLLDELDRFTRTETEHFIIKSTEDPDAAVRVYLADYLQQIYPEICGRFGGEPRDKTIVEMFPAHHEFAIRITAKPWLHTIGASTGRVIAIDAPRVDAAGTSYNWARVLRHEFVHTVTLAATDNRIPHWLTEGLAVWAEEPPRLWEWCLMLAQAWRTDRLFNQEAIDWGFARPRRPNDRVLAYAQSEWMVEYLVEQHGPSIIGKMMARFREGASQADVVQELTGKSPEVFMREFDSWAGQDIASWGLPAERWPTVDEMKAKARDASGEKAGRWWARVARYELEEGDMIAARKDLKRAAEACDQPVAEVGHVRLAMLFKGVPEPATTQRAATLTDQSTGDQVRAIADELLELDPRDPVALKALGQVAVLEKKDDEAIGYLVRLAEVWPRDRATTGLLGGLYLKQKDDDQALPVLQKAAELGTDDADVPFNVARILEAKGTKDEALSWYEKTNLIDPYRREVHERLGELYTQRGRHTDAVREYRVLIRLKGTEASYHCELAMALERAGNHEEARRVAARAVRLNPDCEAGTILSDKKQ